MSNPEQEDCRYMAAALRLAERGLGQCWPNPSVGALLVDKSGIVVGAGTTGAGGRPHAEAIAISEAGSAAKGATLYVSLEPCAHQGETPPCTGAIIASGISRVVCAISDPDSRVAGKGFRQLREARVEVKEGILADAASRVAVGHISRVMRGRPYLYLKLALSADGFIGRAGEGQIPITGEAARRHVHRLRAMNDAILVGIGTARADDPDLRCRLPGCADLSPVRIVLDQHLRLSPDGKIAKSASETPVWVFSGENPDMDQEEALIALGVLIEKTAPNPLHQLCLSNVMTLLAERGITRLMVEGGATIAGALLDADLIDELVVFEGNIKIGKEGILPFKDRKIQAVTSSSGYYLAEARMVGDDRMRTYRKRSV